MPASAFELKLPERRTTCVVFSSPHSGRKYPASFLRASILDQRTIRTSEDAFVDVLLEDVTGFGAPLISAIAPRAFVDLNRAADELDPALVEGVRPIAHNPRVASGLGVIPRVVAGGKAIYSGKLSRAEAEGRIEEWWRPYHDRLHALMEDTRDAFGEAILIDMHSMPHEAIDAMTVSGVRRPDVVIGDRFGAAAAPEIVGRIEAAFESAGLKVMRNSPFAGAYITQAYGRPGRRQHVVQVEIDRSLYMNERDIRPNGNFQGFRRLLSGVLSQIADIGRPEFRLAAE